MSDFDQATGPRLPSIETLAVDLIAALPFHAEVEAVRINGQTGVITVEYRVDGMSQEKKFNARIP